MQDDQRVKQRSDLFFDLFSFSLKLIFMRKQKEASFDW